MIRLATLFSGIGSVEQALERANISHKIIFACDNGDINIEYNTVEDSEYKNNDDIIKVESLESGDIRENIDVEDNINQSSNKLEKECKIILKDKDESIYSLEDFNNEFINKMSDDLIKEIDEINEDSTSNKNETAITKYDFISNKSSELIELIDKMISDD